MAGTHLYLGTRFEWQNKGTDLLRQSEEGRGLGITGRIEVEVVDTEQIYHLCNLAAVRLKIVTL